MKLRVPTVFISSTNEDLSEYREAARDAALLAGFFPSMMEYFTASGARPPVEACLEKVEGADVVVAIVAHRYGWTPPGQSEIGSKSITWLECERAVSTEREVIPLLVDPAAKWPHERCDEFRIIEAIREGKSSPEMLAEIQRSLERLTEFKTWLNGIGIRAMFQSPEEVERHVALALQDWRSRHPDFGRAEPPAFGRWAALGAYRRELVKASRYLPLRGLDLESADPTARQSRLELSKVYVSLDSTVRVDVRDHPAPASNGWWRRFLDKVEGQLNTLATLLVEEALSPEGNRPLGALEGIGKYRHVVVLGGPGSGKSTLLAHLTFCLVQQQLEPDADWVSQLEGWPRGDIDLVPIVVVLRDFARSLAREAPIDADQASLIWRFIQSRLEAQNLRDAAVPLEQALEEGKALVLFDGLDEVASSEARARVRAAVGAFCARYDRSRHIVTCRTLSYQKDEDRLEGFQPLELAPFDLARIDAFIGAWYAELLRLNQVDQHLGATYASRLRKAGRRGDLAPLAQNPLLLTVMALVHTHKGRLPDARAQLYEEIVDILLWRWEARRGDEQVGLRALLREVNRSETDLKRVLWHVAFEIHRDGGSGSDGGLADISESALLGELRTLHPAGSLDWAAQIVELMKLRAGLLLERQPTVFTFPHRTFQEYLAGAYLTVQETFVQQASALAKDPGLWRAAILLAVGRLVHVMGAIERPLALAFELCPGSFDPECGSEGECRQAWLAAEIVDEIGVARIWGLEAGRDLGQRLPATLAGLIEAGPLSRREREELEATLGSLRFDPSRWCLARGIDAPIGFLRVAAGPLVTLSDTEANNGLPARECSQHDVTLPEFFIARYPVTVAQFMAFCDDSGFNLRFTRNARGGANHPITDVSYYEALDYCRWLTEKLRDWTDAPEVVERWLASTIRQGWQVTLPDEAEWEKAARGPGGRVYPWGSDFDPACGNFKETGIGRTSAVGAFPKGRSGCGAFDMSGNVWEWTRSVHGSHFHRPDRQWSSRLLDGLRGPRVLRGGSFLDNRDCARADYRHRSLLSFDCAPDIGFRIVVSFLEP